MNALVWTREAISQEARNYKSKSDFKEASGSAYYACVCRYPGLIDTLFENKIRYWKTEEAVREEALKYKTRKEFQKAVSGAYKSAVRKFPHVLDDVFGESKTLPWSIDELVEEAGKYESRDAMKQGNCGAMAALYKHPDLLESLFPAKYVKWTEDLVRAEAAKYRTKADFIYSNVGAYGYASSLGILDDLGLETGTCGFQTTKKAVFYLSELLLINKQVGVLFGITNRRASTRYTKYEQRAMRNKVALTFEKGSDALRLETSLRRSTKDLTIRRGLSPLRDKLGTSGELLVGVKFEAIYRMVMSLAYNAESIQYHW